MIVMLLRGSGCRAEGSSAKSTTGVLFMLNGGPVHWYSKRQSIVALSTCEAEYVALAIATQDSKWLGPHLDEILGRREKCPVLVGVDNQGAIAGGRGVRHGVRRSDDVACEVQGLYQEGMSLRVLFDAMRPVLVPYLSSPRCMHCEFRGPVGSFPRLHAEGVSFKLQGSRDEGQAVRLQS